MPRGDRTGPTGQGPATGGGRGGCVSVNGTTESRPLRQGAHRGLGRGMGRGLGGGRLIGRGMIDTALNRVSRG